MNQSFRIAIKLEGQEATHYIVRDWMDLENMFILIKDRLERRDDIEYIKWVPIPDLEEVHHA